MPTVALAGLRGTLVEQVAALVAARTGWRICRAEAGVHVPADRSVICLGWEGFSHDTPHAPGLRVLLVAPWELRVQRVMSEANIDTVQAAALAATEQQDRDTKARLAGWSGCDDPRQAHLVVNTARVSPEQAASLIVAAAGVVSAGSKRRRRRPRRGGLAPPVPAHQGQPGQSLPTPAPQAAPESGLASAPSEDGRASPEPPADLAWTAPFGAPPCTAEQPPDPSAGGARFAPVPIHHPRPPGVRPVFAHPSEEEFARMLDFYRVEWQYEPTTFPLEWDDRGNVTLAFTPDFYIPAWDLYVELTTMKQSLVNRKNRKIRRLKELYPHVNIKTFYGRDFERLLRKFGREGVLTQTQAPTPAFAETAGDGRPEAPAPGGRGGDSGDQAGGAGPDGSAGPEDGFLQAGGAQAARLDPVAGDEPASPMQTARDQVAAAGAGDGAAGASPRAAQARRRGRGRPARSRGGRG